MVPYKEMQTGLKYIYEQLNLVDSWKETDKDYEAHGTWTTFDQREFVGIDSDRNWNEVWNWLNGQWKQEGKIYIPDACKDKQCHVHFAMHGCWFPILEEYDGYLELAATNDIIVVYPHSKCWNADNSVEQMEGNYLTKDGLYPKALMAMICRLTSANEESADCPTLPEDYEATQGLREWVQEEWDNWMNATAITSTTVALLASLTLLQ